MMRAIVPALAVLLLALPAGAENLPQFPKAGPPQPLPEAPCDTAAANSGDWLLGRWVGPGAKWSFTRDGGTLAWTLDRKGGINDGFGWREGATLTGTVTAVSACTLTLTGGDGAFLFEGVLTEAGKLYGYAVNPKGDHVRFVLRRER